MSLPGSLSKGSSFFLSTFHRGMIHQGWQFRFIHFEGSSFALTILAPEGLWIWADTRCRCSGASDCIACWLTCMIGMTRIPPTKSFTWWRTSYIIIAAMIPFELGRSFWIYNQQMTRLRWTCLMNLLEGRHFLLTRNLLLLGVFCTTGVCRLCALHHSRSGAKLVLAFAMNQKKMGSEDSVHLEPWVQPVKWRLWGSSLRIWYPFHRNLAFFAILFPTIAIIVLDSCQESLSDALLTTDLNQITTANVIYQTEFIIDLIQSKNTPRCWKLRSNLLLCPSPPRFYHVLPLSGSDRQPRRWIAHTIGLTGAGEPRFLTVSHLRAVCQWDVAKNK